ncbi:helitron_like_N domain-containing protein [Trichonephila clavipes]|nr:helitron_like_N domain-containing protein [Trichonephila clavipes]
MAVWKDNAAYSYNPSIDYKSDASCTLGPMSITCQFCSLMKFKGETLGLCCSGGKVHLPVLKNPPESLHTLLLSDSVCAKVFQKNIRGYNSCIQMTLFGSSKQLRLDLYLHLKFKAKLTTELVVYFLALLKNLNFDRFILKTVIPNKLNNVARLYNKLNKI